MTPTPDPPVAALDYKGMYERTATRLDAALLRAIKAEAALAAQPAPPPPPIDLWDWQRDLLTFDADRRSLDQVVAELLGVKSVDLRTEQDNEGNATSEDRQWRVQYFGGTYGGTLRQCLDSGSLDVELLARALWDTNVTLAWGAKEIAAEYNRLAREYAALSEPKP